MKKKKPIPDDYGLPDNVYALEKELEAKSVNEQRKNTGKYLLLNIIVSGLLMIIGQSEGILPVFLIGMFVLGFIGFFQLLVLWLADGKSYLQKNETYQKIQIYKNDAAQYEHSRNLMKESYWDRLSGHQFEQAFADACMMRGYSAKVSKSGGDGGIDVILNKDGHRIVVQCKAHKKKIGPGPVRDLYGVMMANGFSEGWVVSKSGFSDNAIKFAEGKSISLFDMKDVIVFAGTGFYDRYGIDSEEE